jgi:hypothetical protein
VVPPSRPDFDEDIKINPVDEASTPKAVEKEAQVKTG